VNREVHAGICGSLGVRFPGATRPQGSVRREILDRILIVNAAHLRKVLTEYETYFNEHRPHRALNQASPLRALPDPIDADITVIRRDRLGGLLHEYSQVA
jgi:putative transposase